MTLKCEQVHHARGPFSYLECALWWRIIPADLKVGEVARERYADALQRRTTAEMALQAAIFLSVYTYKIIIETQRTIYIYKYNTAADMQERTCPSPLAASHQLSEEKQKS